MYRDRTNLFISYRQSYTHHPQFIPSTGRTKSKYSKGGDEDEELGLIAHTDENDDVEAIEMDRLPPVWIDLSDEVDEQLAQIDTQITRLGTLHRANALPGFDDRTAEEAEIERLTFDITAALHRCQALIKRFADLARRGAANAEEERLSANMRIAMATRVQVRSTTFRKMQSSYLKSLRKEALMTTGADAGGGVSADTPLLLDSSTDVLDADIDESFSHETLRQQQEQQQQQSLVTQDNEMVLRQREEEITKIATGILELSEIFKDLQTMVIDQGTLLDRIDYNVENMHTNVKQADKELVQATHYQKRTQKCKIILLLSLLVLGLFIILLIKPKRHHSHDDGGGSSTAPPPSVDHNNAPDAGHNRYLL